MAKNTKNMKRKDFLKSLRESPVSDFSAKIKEAKKEFFLMATLIAQGDKAPRIKIVKRNIARMHTIAGEKQREQAKVGGKV